MTSGFSPNDLFACLANQNMVIFNARLFGCVARVIRKSDYESDTEP